MSLTLSSPAFQNGAIAAKYGEIVLSGGHAVLRPGLHRL